MSPASRRRSSRRTWRGVPEAAPPVLASVSGDLGLHEAGLNTGFGDAASLLNRRRDEAVEQRVRPLWARLELRVELAGDEPRVIRQLHDLHQPAVWRLTGQDHARRLERLAEAVVHLEAMAVPLVDYLLAVRLGGLGAAGQGGRGDGRGHRPPPFLE